MTHWGIDYAYGNGVTTEQLKKHGVEFVCRYLSWEPNAKNITKTELANLHAAGIEVVLNWESNGTMLSYAQGHTDATEAQRQAAELGHPHAPLYFSLDVDPHTVNMADVLLYLQGAGAAIGKDRVGIYGGYLAVHAALNSGHAKYAWQTYAWSGGVWDQRANIRQYSNNVALGPTTVDQDSAAKDYYGQLHRPAPPAPPTLYHEHTSGGIRDLEAYVKDVAKTDIATFMADQVRHYGHLDPFFVGLLNVATYGSSPVPKGTKTWVKS